MSKPHEIKGEGIVAFVTLKTGYEGNAGMLAGFANMSPR